MLTPQEVSSKEFVKAVFGGYDMSAVDEFLEQLNADYSALYKENAILKGKIKVLVEKVEEYRSTEDSMRMALLTAQKMGDDIVAKATEKSNAMLNDASVKSSTMVEEAAAKSKAYREALEKETRAASEAMRIQLADEEARLAAAEESTRKFVAASQEIMRQHSLFLSRIELIKHTPEEAPAPVVEEPSYMEEAYTETAASVAEEVPAKPDPVEPVADVDAAELAPEAEPVVAETEKAAKPAEEKSGLTPEETAKEAEIVDAARDICSAVAKIVAEEIPQPEVKPLEQVEHKQIFEAPAQEAEFRTRTEDSTWSDDDEPTSPRPKFAFDNLRFGSNYSKEN